MYHPASDRSDCSEGFFSFISRCQRLYVPGFTWKFDSIHTSSEKRDSIGGSTETCNVPFSIFTVN